MSKIKEAMMIAEEMDSEEFNRAMDEWEYEKAEALMMEEAL